MLRKLGWPVFPVFRDLAGLGHRLLVLAVVLPGHLNDGGLDDLAAFGQIAGLLQMLVETAKQAIDGTGPNQTLAKQPDGLGIHGLADKRSDVEKEALSATSTDQGAALSAMFCIACRVIHERQPVLDPGLVVGDLIKHIQHQGIEHQNCRKWRATTLRSVRSLQCLAIGFSNTGPGMITFSFFLFCD